MHPLSNSRTPDTAPLAVSCESTATSPNSFLKQRQPIRRVARPQLRHQAEDELRLARAEETGDGGDGDRRHGRSDGAGRKGDQR